MKPTVQANTWSDEFDKKFVRDDGLMDKYYCEGKEQDFMATAIKNFISSTLAEEYKRGYWERNKDDKEEKEILKSDEAHRTAEGYCCACGYDMAVMERKIKEAHQKGFIDGADATGIQVSELKIEKLKKVVAEARKEDIKLFEKATRLYLQDAWNDQSEIQALSPKGKVIIWGGLIGKEITKEWLKIKKYLKELL